MIREEEGAISIAAALIIPVLLIFLVGIFRFAVMARADWEAMRLVAASVEAELAGYDRELFEDFGLFAAPMDGSRAKAAITGMTKLSHAPPTILGSEPLGTAEKMQSEIVRHMKLRAPLTMLSSILSRTSSVWRERAATLPNQSLESAMQNMTNEADTRGFIADRIDLPEGEAREQLEALIEEEISSLYEEVLTEMMPADLYEPGESAEHDLFDPKNLTQIGRTIDDLFRIGHYGVLERLYLAEYALAYFHQTTPVIYVQATRVEFRTPDGRQIADFPASRHFEIERMLMGGTAEKAKRRTHNAVRAMRTVIHLAANFSDQAKRAVYLSKATTLSTAIVVVSLGTLTIPPESLMFLFMLKDAVSEAKHDLRQLTRGFGVRFWPNARLELYYPDYLRLMLLLKTPERLAEAIYEAIEDVYPGSHYTAVEAIMPARDRLLSLQGNYRKREADAN